MMHPAEWDRVLVADFFAHGAGLRETQVMSVRWGPSAEKARLPAHELQMVGFAAPLRPVDEQLRLDRFGLGDLLECPRLRKSVAISGGCEGTFRLQWRSGYLLHRRRAWFGPAGGEIGRG